MCQQLGCGDASYREGKPLKEDGCIRPRKQHSHSTSVTADDSIYICSALIIIIINQQTACTLLILYVMLGDVKAVARR